jgi:hypothetical protein
MNLLMREQKGYRGSIFTVHTIASMRTCCPLKYKYGMIYTSLILSASQCYSNNFGYFLFLSLAFCVPADGRWRVVGVMHVGVGSILFGRRSTRGRHPGGGFLSPSPHYLR